MRKIALAAVFAFTLGGCAGQTGTPGTDGRTVLLRTTPELAGADCANGGLRVDTGVDDDGDGTLEDAEVDATAHVCDGADGSSVVPSLEDPGATCPQGGVRLTPAAGAPSFVCNGAPGAEGQPGESVTVTPETAGANCTYGGERLQVGTGTPTYVCDGAPGADGQAGESVAMTPEAPGAHCTYGGERLQVGTGTPTYVCNGAPGADGLSVTMTQESAGTMCAYGGQRLQIGSGTPSYVCNGAPGAAGATGDSVAMTPEDPGASCAYGGQRLQVGTGDPAYVCNGAPGLDGASVTMTPEPPGANCVFGGVALQVETGPVSYVCSGTPSGVTLATIATAPVVDVRYVEAVVTATITDDGGELVLARGTVLATHATPTLHDSVYLGETPAATFGTRCDGLSPATTYYVRAFATNALGTSYGNEESFTTRALTVPAISTVPASNLTSSTALSGGIISDDGGTPILGRGICWSLAPEPTTAGTCASEGVGAGSFVALATGLASSTTYHVRAYATNAQGTAYGEDLTFATTAEPFATVTTAAATSVSYTTATLGGTVVSDAGAPVSTRGVCWSTSPGPTTASAKYTESAGLGPFGTGITGLTANTTYYVRAFAVNAGGTSYGNEVSFGTLAPALPSLTTKAIAGVSSYMAGSGGVVATDGGSAIAAKGVCWSLNPGPTTANTCTNDGAGAASFNSTLSGLNPLTTYYVRAYATNGIGTAYGNELSFATTDLVGAGPTAPVVGTATTAIATGSTASSGGYVTSDGGSPVTARGVCWSTSPNPVVGGACSTDGGSGLGYFSSTVTGLSGCGIVYYVRAYASNSTGTGYGSQTTVSTGLVPTVTTEPITAVGYTGATSGGTIVDNGGCPITQKGVAWSWSPSPTTGNPKTTDGSGDAAFVSSITGLYSNRTYYVRAYATNSVGTSYGSQQVFATAEPPTPYLGQSYAGGIVFYVDGSGLHGLAAAPTDQGAMVWGCPGTNAVTSTAFGSGASNTAAILGACTQVGTAASNIDALVLNGYGDWFLPSRDEVILMWANLASQGLGSFNTGTYYWSSSQYDTGTAWTLRSWSNSWGGYDKSYSFTVRAVRAF